jgi:hypothetical protein
LSTATGSLTANYKLCIGGTNDGASTYGPTDAAIAYCAMWKRNAWLDTHLQSTVAAERFARLVGCYAYCSLGTATPTALTRASTRYNRKWESNAYKLYKVGNNWPAIESFSDGVVAYVPESSRTNLCTDSEDFSAAAWTAVSCSISTNTAIAPNGTTTADTLHEDGTAANTHYIYDYFNQAALTSYVFSCFVKANNRAWCLMQIYSSTDAGVTKYFNLNTGVAGASGSATSYSIENYGNGWYRCSIEAFRTTAETASVSIFAASADGTVVFDGLNQDSFYLWGAQCEAVTAANTPAPYMPTVASTNVTNLLTYSEQFDNAAWGKIRASVVQNSTTAPDGTLTADILHEDSTAANSHYAALTTTATKGEYILSVFAKALNRNWLYMYVYSVADGVSVVSFNLTTGALGSVSGIRRQASGIESYGNGWYRCWNKFTESTRESLTIAFFIGEADDDNVFDGLNQDSLYLWGAQLEAVTSPSTPTPYMPTVASANATNLLTYSEQFDNAAWGKIRASVVQNSTTAPDGTLTADILHEDSTAANSHYAALTTTATKGEYILSVFAKALNRNWLYMYVYSVADGVSVVSFNLTTGVLGAVSGTRRQASGIESYDNGWYRCWNKFIESTSESLTIAFFIGEADDDNVFDGLNQDSLYLWGAQLEKASEISTPSAYIKTSGGIATRAAPTLRYLGDNGNINNNARIGAIQFKINVLTIRNSFLFDITDGGSPADRITGWIDGTTGYVCVKVGSTLGAMGTIIGTSNVRNGVEHTILVSWRDNSVKLYVDGVQEDGTDSDVIIPDELDRIDIGISRAGTWMTEGRIYDVKIYYNNVA